MFTFLKVTVKDTLPQISQSPPLTSNALSPLFLPLSEAALEFSFLSVFLKCDKKYCECH